MLTCLYSCWIVLWRREFTFSVGSVSKINFVVPRFTAADCNCCQQCMLFWRGCRIIRFVVGFWWSCFVWFGKWSFVPEPVLLHSSPSPSPSPSPYPAVKVKVGVLESRVCSLFGEVSKPIHLFQPNVVWRCIIVSQCCDKFGLLSSKFRVTVRF